VPNAKYICEAVDKLKEAWVFDGEFYVKNWNKTQSLVMTQSEHPDAKELCISVFDAMPFKDWMAKESEPLSIRRARVDRLVAKIKSVNVTSMKFFLVRNRKKDILDAYNRALNNGNEGLMLKDPDAAYPFKRDKVWLRHKPKITSDCEVTGIKWGNKGKTGQMLGLIGSLGCKFKWRGKRITFNCSGMDMLMRRKLTKMYKREELVGKIVEVEHEGVTVHGKVRFPQMQRLRLDKDEAN
jgi:ATP-dependent DNA ligase